MSPIWTRSSRYHVAQNGVDWPPTRVVRGGAALYGGDRRLPRRKLMDEVVCDRYFPRWLPRGTTLSALASAPTGDIQTRAQ